MLLALHLHQRPDALLGVRARVHEGRVASHLARKDTEHVDPARERIGDGLEDEGGGAGAGEVDRRTLPGRRRNALDEQVEERTRPEVPRRDAARDWKGGTARHRVLESVRDLVHGQLLALQVLLHQRLVDLDDLVKQLLAVLGDLVGHRVRNRLRILLAPALVGDIRAHVDEVDDAGELVFMADRQLDDDAALGQLLAHRVEILEEVRPLAVQHVHEDDAREAELLGAPPQARGADLDAHHAADREERTLDDAQRRDRVSLEARVARSVDHVDLAPLPLEAAERGLQRHLARALLVVPVRDGRAGVDRAQPVRLAGLEEHRLDERRLPHAAVADDSDVADLPGLESRHRRSFLPGRRLSWILTRVPQPMDRSCRYSARGS